MKYEKLSLVYPFNIGSFLNAKVGIEVSLEEGDDIATCYEQLSRDAKMLAAKETSSTQEEESYPYSGSVPLPKDYMNVSNVTIIQPEEKRIGVLVSDIESCKDLNVLSTYKFIVKTDKNLQEAYDKKYTELSKQPA